MKPTNMVAASVLAVCGLILTGTAFAAVSADKANELGSKLTPVGAIMAGSKDGMVPKWDPTPQHGSLSGAYASAPKIEAEKPLYTIDASNMAKYADMLSNGSKYLLKNFADYKMNVYPSHRTVGWPDFIYKATKANATTCKLPDVDDPDGCKLGFPYPIPNNGAEVIWNHKIKWRGNNIERTNDQLIVDPDGHYQNAHLVEDVQFLYANSKKPIPLVKGHGLFLNYMAHLLAPPRVSGEILLVHESGGTGAEGRQAWLYAPALKRIRRAPSVCCDNPYEGTDGLQFYDQVDMFNGILQRYTWKLLGKKEMVIPYDNFKIGRAKYKDIVRPHHINQDLPRYEVHRVWVVEADLRPGERHTYAKRVFYVDEDSWDIVMVDCYDAKGELFNFQEGMLTPQYNVQTAFTVPEIIYHFDSGRYFVTALQAEGKPNDYSVTFPPGYFNPVQVQQSALH